LHCNVAFVVDGRPWVIPTIHARVGDHIYLHGAPANHMLRSATGGREVCVSATLVDGLVLARSWFHHSMNYRSVVLFGTAERVDDAGEKRAALRALVEHVMAGRSDDARPPTDEELRATLVLRVPIEEASAKVRSGGPIDDEEDLASGVWAGEVPLRHEAGEPRPDPVLGDGRAASVPGYVLAGRPAGSGAVGEGVGEGVDEVPQ
jgi:nitroimidazol reductase NimA-like FMN-containing flavoprotein (pyridoxamine 5'-phosphate oxidase superfamily)